MPRRTKTATPRPQPLMPITVVEDGYHRPHFINLEGKELMVETIDQQWQDDAEPGSINRCTGFTTGLR